MARGFTKALCGGTEYYEITCCGGNVLTTGLIYGYADKGLGPVVRTNTHNTNYTLRVGAVDIPIYKTVRRWESVIESSLGQPTGPVRGIVSGSMIYGTFCSPFTDSIYTTMVSEDCVVEASTLHYLDTANSICLYRYTKEDLKFSAGASGKIEQAPLYSSAVARFQGPYGLELYWKVAVPSTDAVARCVEQWVLVVGDTSYVLAETPYTISPLTARTIPGVGCNAEAVETGEIFLFPAPGTYSNPVDCDVLTYGWYANGEQAGDVNYFYPYWCKGLHIDPIWLAAEQARTAAVFDHYPLPEPSTTYTPPPITVDPIPRGSVVKHPVLGIVYQWLVTNRNGINSMLESHDFNKLIDKKLPTGVTTHDTTLYSPISII